MIPQFFPYTRVTEVTANASVQLQAYREEGAYIDSNDRLVKVRYVRNASGAPIPANRLVVWVAGSSENVQVATTGQVNGRICGVTPAAIPNGYSGWVVFHGEVGILADAPTTAGNSITAGNANGINGAATDAGGPSGTSVIGQWIDNGVAAGSVATAHVMLW